MQIIAPDFHRAEVTSTTDLTPVLLRGVPHRPAMVGAHAPGGGAAGSQAASRVRPPAASTPSAPSPLRRPLPVCPQRAPPLPPVAAAARHAARLRVALAAATVPAVGAVRCVRPRARQVAAPQGDGAARAGAQTKRIAAASARPTTGWRARAPNAQQGGDADGARAAAAGVTALAAVPTPPAAHAVAAVVAVETPERGARARPRPHAVAQASPVAALLAAASVRTPHRTHEAAPP